MQIVKAFRFRIYPTPEQIARIEQWEHALRFLWNLAHEQRLMGLARPKAERRYPTAFSQMRELTDLRKQFPWLADVPRDVCAQVLTELDKAWQRCFGRLGCTPRWKSRHHDPISACENHSKKWRVEGGRVWFPKIGTIRTTMHRPLDGTPKTCTIKRDGDQWFACILSRVEIPDPPVRTTPIVAIDRGIANFGATSDGDFIANPQFLKATLKRLARAQQTVSRRKKGSKNREKAKHRVMRLHRKVRRQREHFLHVQTARLAKSHGVVVLEKLNVEGMKRSNLGRSISDASWSKFAEFLKYKMAWSGGSVIEVPAAYSSQTCAACGVVDAASRRSQSEFRCTSCGHSDHADLNAAKILLTRASRSGKPMEATGCNSGLRSGKRLRVARRAPDYIKGAT